MGSGPLRVVLALVIAVWMPGICGCGGGGTGTSVPGPPAPTVQALGTVSGSVSGGGVNVARSRLLLDGVQLPVAVGVGGAFEIPGIRPGEHVLDVIGPEGMHAGRVTFRAVAGATSSVGTISLTPTGQIVGIVTRRDGNLLTALAGVEVVASSDIPSWEQPPPPGLEDVGRPDEAVVVAPTDPEGAEYHATTDVDGSYVMKGVRPGLYVVSVAVPGLRGGEQVAFVRAGHTAAVDFELEPTIAPGVGTVDCTVYGVYEGGSRAPLPGAIVEVFPEQGWELPRPDAPLILPPEAPFPAGLAAALRTVDEIERPPAPPAGDGGGWVVEPPRIIWERFATITDAAGHCSLNVPAGYCQVSAWRWGYEPAQVRVAVTDGATVAVSFDLGLCEMPALPPLFDGEEPPGPPGQTR